MDGKAATASRTATETMIENERFRRMMRPELATESWLFLGGWVLLTAGIIEFFPGHGLAIGLVSAGLLLLTAVGWRVILEVVCAGLYVPEPDVAPEAPPPPPPPPGPNRSHVDRLE